MNETFFVGLIGSFVVFLFCIIFFSVIAVVAEGFSFSFDSFAPQSQEINYKKPLLFGFTGHVNS